MCACSLSFTVVSLALMHGAFFVGMLRTRVDCDRAPHPGVVLWVSRGPAVRCFEVRVGVRRRLECSVCQMTSNLPWSVRKLELGMSEIALLGMKKGCWEVLRGKR